MRAFDAGLSASRYRVSAVQADGSKRHMGGNFFRAAAPNIDYLNRVDINSGLLDAGWQPNTRGSVEALALQGSVRYVGGSFVNAIPPSGGNRLLRIPDVGNGTVDGKWNTTTNDSVLSRAHACHAQLVAGGSFSTAGGHVRNGLAGYQTASGDRLVYSGFETP